MKERPALMKGPLVVKTIRREKWQTRRLSGLERINANPEGLFASSAEFVSRTGTAEFYHRSDTVPIVAKCPYGKAGDALWIKETHAFCPKSPQRKTWSHTPEEARVLYRADGEMELSGPLGFHRPKWRPSIHMPRWASRLTLSVESVRVERLQDISEEDAKAEGVEPANGHPIRGAFLGIGPCYREGFAQLWEDINGDRPGCAWADSPWVWVVNFSVAEVRR